MPYAGLGCHRREEWLAIVRGYGKYLAAQESYNNANRHGLFFGNGYLDILGGGKPVTIADSGCRPNDGWDWRRLDGTTVIHMPYAQMANGNGTMSERSGETFVGGVNHQGRDGLFAMSLNSAFQYRKALPKGTQSVDGHSFRGRKSYFFFDSRIVCLGSGIHNDDSPNPVQTNLFQKFLGKTETPVYINGEPWADFPGERTLDKTRVNTILDPQDTGYLLFPGQDVRLARAHQTSRDGHDKRDTDGDYASAWIDHGPNPQDASYAYVALVKTTPEGLTQFAKAMGRAESMPVSIALQDDALHACYDRATNTWGLAYFQPGEVPPLHRPIGVPAIPVVGVDQPCLIMTSQEDGRLTISLAYPDLELDKAGISQQQPVNVTLNGRWRMHGTGGVGVFLPMEHGNSILKITCVQGKTSELVLQRR
jgi:chondroitin-sulfate-ABC endolyase/exolyase